MMDQLLYILWDVDPQLFPWLEIPRWYGLMWALGIFFSYLVMAYVYRKEGKSLEALDQLSLYIILGTILGARLGHILFYDPIYYWQHPLEILPFQMEPEFQFSGLSGLASHGGAMGVLLALYLYCSKYQESFLWIVDRLVIVGALTGAFIRFGNLMNSEIIGTTTDVPWAFIFSRVDILPRHPAQLYESIFCLLLFFVLLGLWKSGKFRQRPGFMLGLFLVMLFSFRFVVEFFKIDQVSFEAELLLNMGQILSIPFVVIGIMIMGMSRRWNEAEKNVERITSC